MMIETTIIPQEQVVPLIFSLLVIISATCLTAYRQVIMTVQDNTEQMLQLEKNRLEKDYMKNVEESLQQLRMTKHNLKNHLIIIENYAKNGAVDKITKHIEQISFDIEQADTIRTASITVSSLLNAKQQICSNHNISFEHSLNFSNIYIDDYSIITILGNIMDNAITAASKLSDGYISLKMKQLDSHLNIHCENNHCETIKEKDGHFISSKLDSNGFHGLGIRSIQKTISNLNGSININYSDSLFCVDILVPNYS